MARGDTSAASLAPGFRFHPTDEELVRYYLKRKVTNKPFRFDAIADVDIYKTEPWDLPGKSKLKTRDLEWYFFSMLDRKYGNGSKTNRATEKGYWKTTGKDRPIRWNSRNVGMKKTLVYHLGRAPRGERTNWVMHEYRLTDEDLEKAGVVQDAFVLCRIFQKSGTGPKNGEQYGAPFIEEEWDNDDELDLLPGEEMVVSDEVAVGDDAYAEQNELDQNFEFALASKNAPDNYYYGESSNFVEQSRNFSKDQKPLTERETSYFVEQSGNFSEDQKPMIERGTSYFVEQCGNFSKDQKPITVKETSDFVDQSRNLSRDQKPIIERETSNFEEQSANFNGDQMPGTETEVQYCSDLPDGKVLFRLPNQCKVDEKPVRREFIAESSTNIDAIDSNYLLEEPFLDAIENPPLDEGFFLEDNDLSNPVEPDSIRGPTEFDMVDEYLSYFDPDNLTFDPSELIGSDDVAFDEAPLSKEDLRGGTEEVPKEKELYQTVNNTDASSSNPEKPVLTKLQPDIKYPFMKQASQLLGNIPAPPAFASEFPLKGMQLNAAPSSSSIRVTAGMIRIENVTFGGNGMDWSFGKNGNVNIVLSFTMPAGSASPASLDPVGNSFSDKTMSGVSRSWFFFMFFWVLILSISFKMGTYICAN